MQIESLFIISQEKEILFCCHCLPESKNWNEYQTRLVKLIPNLDENCLPYMMFDDIVVGFGFTGKIYIIITASLTSNFIVDSIMDLGIKQIKKIIGFICKDDLTPAKLMERNHYIQLQILLQHEISAKGYMRFIPSEEFESLASF